MTLARSLGTFGHTSPSSLLGLGTSFEKFDFDTQIARLARAICSTW